PHVEVEDGLAAWLRVARVVVDHVAHGAWRQVGGGGRLSRALERLVVVLGSLRCGGGGRGLADDIPIMSIERRRAREFRRVHFAQQLQHARLRRRFLAAALEAQQSRFRLLVLLLLLHPLFFPRRNQPRPARKRAPHAALHLTLPRTNL